MSGLKNELELSKGSVCITFDDGYSEAAGAVGEILLKHNVNACFFVITGVLDGTHKPYGTDYMNWDDVR
ncbi:MAG: Polysaccharide deacetylase, partial [Thermodesulfobacteriota bacterium]|nr:Polysaccharide deacetylase [Thermodesulfobacteriota bacterium]